MHETSKVLALGAPTVGDPARARSWLTFCYQCHCAVDLRAATRAFLRSGHWARIGTCAHCGTTVTRIVRG